MVSGRVDDRVRTFCKLPLATVATVMFPSDAEVTTTT